MSQKKQTPVNMLCLMARICETWKRNEGAYIVIEAVGATPIRPSGLPRFVIVFPREDVDDGMDETEDKAVGYPVDDDVDCHVVVVDRNTVCGESGRERRGRRRGVKAQQPSHS